MRKHREIDCVDCWTVRGYYIEVCRRIAVSCGMLMIGGVYVRIIFRMKGHIYVGRFSVSVTYHENMRGVK